MNTVASQITSFTIVYSTVYSDADQRKYRSSASLAFVRGLHRRPVNSPHEWPVTRKVFPFDDVIMDIDWVFPEYSNLSTIKLISSTYLLIVLHLIHIHNRQITKAATLLALYYGSLDCIWLIMRWGANNKQGVPDNKVHGANMGPIRGQQDPGGPMLAPWTLLSGVFMGDFVTSPCPYVTALACYHKMLHLFRAVKLPWIFSGAPLSFTEAPGNIKVTITGMQLPTKYTKYAIQNM